MKIGCGVDIIEIERIKQNIEELGDNFLNRIYTEKEIKYCESKNMQKYQHYAVRFAAKEATFKAVSNILDGKFSIGWKDIEVNNKKEGKPELIINNIDNDKIESKDISLSHCRDYAIANVTILLK